MKNPAIRTFYHSDRRIFEISKDAASNLFCFCNLSSIEIPGPGEYMAPSEFGQYENRLKFNNSTLLPQSPRGLTAGNE
jgi:hypothetical protein